MYKKMFHIVIGLALFGFCCWQCNDPIFQDGGDEELVFSADTVSFDTIFTSFGSTTQYITVRNPYAQPMKISSIELAGEKSYFRLNIDGVAANKQTNLEIRAKDSIYIFIEVTIDPNNDESPVLIEDSIAFTVNGIKSHVLLQAFGQDVHVLRNAKIATTTFSGKKPYVIFDTLYVMPKHTLTIEKGVTLCFYKNAILIADGNLEVKGTVDERVVFRGHRYDEIWEGYKYDYNASLWSGIDLYPSHKKHTIHNATIRNAETGIYSGFLLSEDYTQVELVNTIVHNHSLYGLYMVNSELDAKNCQITNGGAYNLRMVGGKAQFIHCTFANYFGLDMNTKRKDIPSIFLQNVIKIEEDYYAIPIEKAYFYNCIIDGNLKNELALYFTDEYDFDFKFYHSSLKAKDSIKIEFPDRFESCIFTDSVKFLKVERWNYDFSLDTISPMCDIADPMVIDRFPEVLYDIRGNSRMADGKPDLGAYEFTLTKEKP